jgi:hypothetical protein
MNRRIVCVAGLILFGLRATPARAQDKGDVGLTISTPTAIGVIWHATPRLAIRPEVSFALAETDGEGSGPDVGSSSVNFGGSALFYAVRWDNLRTYLSPRFTYSWASTDFQSGSSTFDSTQTSWGLSGSLGAQYALGSRFAVFAEAGLLYTSQRSESPSLILTTERTTWTFGSRTAVGGTLYF